MYYRKLNTGTYNIVYSADGYKDFEVSGINVLKDAQTVLNVQLEEADNTDIDSILDNDFKLISYINPFNDVLDIEFELPKETQIQILVYNISGKMVLDTKSKLYNSGVNTFRINTQSLETGFYVCVLKSTNFNFDIKLIKI